jgi:DNA polymerase phi
LKALIQTVETEPQTILSILPQLIGGNGTYNFDKVTKTKTVEKLLIKVDESNAKEVIDVLVAPTIIVQGYLIDSPLSLTND